MIKMPPRGRPGVDGEAPAATVYQVSKDEVNQASIGGLKGLHYGSQFVGGSYKANRTNIFISAISKPEEYLALRAGEIDKINKEIDTAFSEKYSKWLSQGVPPADALARSQNYIMTLSKALYADLDAEYPEDIQQTAANLSYTRSAAGQGGFDPAAAAKPRATRRRK